LIKTWKSLGFAVLVAALLVGMAAGEDESVVAVQGTVEAAFSVEDLTMKTFATFDPSSSPATQLSSIDIQTNTEWDLTVYDCSNSPADEPGKMELFSSGNYLTGVDTGLVNNFEIHVEGEEIGNTGFTSLSNVGTLPDDQVNAAELASGAATGQAGKTLNLQFYQPLTFDDVAGTYRIGVAFVLGPNV
jgi:hypothetical protein